MNLYATLRVDIPNYLDVAPMLPFHLLKSMHIRMKNVQDNHVTDSCNSVDRYIRWARLKAFRIIEFLFNYFLNGTTRLQSKGRQHLLVVEFIYVKLILYFSFLDWFLTRWWVDYIYKQSNQIVIPEDSLIPNLLFFS